jgi:hypothetical protein
MRAFQFASLLAFSATVLASPTPVGLDDPSDDATNDPRFAVETGAAREKAGRKFFL